MNQENHALLSVFTRVFRYFTDRLRRVHLRFEEGAIPMELKAGALSDIIVIKGYKLLTVTLTYGSIKLFLKGEAGIKICFFSSIREQLSVDTDGYETMVLEAFDDCAYTIHYIE